MQIYPTLYKPKYKPKSFKSYNLNLSAKPTNSISQSAFRFHRGIKSARQKRHRQKREKSLSKGIQAMTYDVIA